MKAAYQRTASGKYRRQMRHPVTGEKVSITAGTLGELETACERIRRVREDLRLGNIDQMTAMRALRPQAAKPTRVRELWERYYPGISAASRDGASSNWNRRLEPYFAEQFLWELEEDMMRTWEQRLLAHGFAPKTIRGAYDFLAGAYKMAIDAGDLPAFPWRKWRPGPAVARRTRESVKTLVELERLLFCAREGDQKRWAVGRYSDEFFTILVLALTGMRQGEAGALSWSYVELDSPPHVLRVEYQAKRWWRRRSPDRPRDPPKTGKRTQLMHPHVVEALRAQREQLKRYGWYRDDGPVFPGRHGAWSKTGRVLKPERLREIVVAAGLPNADDWTTHSLRHSFATLEALGSGGDLKSTMARTGHKSIEVLQTYLHPATRADQAPSMIGNLSPRALPALEIHELPPAPGSALPELVTQVGKEAVRAKDRHEEAREEARRKPLDDAAREWLLDGSPKAVPLAARKAFRLAYSRGYTRARLAGSSPEQCQQAAQRSRVAAQAAWGATVSRATRSLRAEGLLSDSGPVSGVVHALPRA